MPPHHFEQKLPVHVTQIPLGMEILPFWPETMARALRPAFSEGWRRNANHLGRNARDFGRVTLECTIFASRTVERQIF